MQTTRAYLTQRVKQVLRVDELDVKDLPLNTLMSAYASVYEHGDAGNDHRISMKIPALATHYAEKLCAGKFVIIRDPFDNKQYFVKAHQEDLIAVSYAIGPWSNIYSVKATSERALKELNITAAVIVDLRVLDHIFGFRPWQEEEDVNEVAAVVATPSEGVRWDWHTGHSPKKKEQHAAQTAEGRVVEARVPVAEVVGEPHSETMQGDNQMTRAFQHANQEGHQGSHHGRRERRQHAERRAHELNQPDQGNKQS
ncbi:hypothetical protein AVU38_gp030 [Ralstonia phage RSL2]|nr:hypothetical protein AVU38_gp030 [Ralstonia phage RSL2]